MEMVSAARRAMSQGPISSGDRPASIFSWQEGVYVAERDEWESLRGEYVTAWNAA